jgi:hypothetical protein
MKILFTLIFSLITLNVMANDPYYHCKTVTKLEDVQDEHEMDLRVDSYQTAIWSRGDYQLRLTKSFEKMDLTIKKKGIIVSLESVVLNIPTIYFDNDFSSSITCYYRR